MNYLPDVVMITWLYMTIIFIFSLIQKDNSIADTFWGLGFIVIAVYSLIQSGEIDLRKLLVSVLVGLWGIRLSFHIYMRNRGKGEDFRYQEWRKKWKFFFLRSYFQVFMLQGLFMIIISSPVWFINFSNSRILGLWDFIGLLIFGAGFVIENQADSQLIEFKKKPENQGKLLTTGLWSVSRHPNYFGETLVWFGIFFYTIPSDWGWITLLSPVVITILLRFVSGVPLLEKHLMTHPGWEEYKKQTAPLIPFVHWF